MGRAEDVRVRLAEAELTERTVHLRLPFRFGIATMTEARQAVLRVRIERADGTSAVGISAECLLPKWFDKSPQLSDADNVEQLRRSLALALDLYRQAGTDTPFGLSARVYPQQQARCGAQGLNPLVASYGPALVDRAVLDAVGRMLGLSFARMITANVPGLAVTSLTPDLSGFDLSGFLAGLAPAKTIAVRHTVGLVDALGADDLDVDAPDDGLPRTLEEVVGAYGCRYFKIKVCGDPAADLDRLGRIAGVLDARAGAYQTTLDGNEQYGDVDGLTEFWHRILERPGLRRLAASVLCIEQPIARAVALQRPVAAFAALKPLMIDESDGDLDAFPRAIALGYQGVSSKTCKGFYKSILNAARVARRNADGRGKARYFLSAEDLCTWAGISTQQDIALVSLLGLTHLERNGHHYIDGMCFAPDDEQDRFVAAHPDLYHRSPGKPARLTIRDGQLAIGSLNCPGFAVGVIPDDGGLHHQDPQTRSSQAGSG